MSAYADANASSTALIAEAAGPSPIDRSLVELAEARARLTDRLERLEGKLASVLTPALSDATTATPDRDDPASTVRVRIDNETETLDALAVRVADLITRLEV